MTISKAEALRNAMAANPYFFATCLVSDGHQWGPRLSKVQIDDLKAMAPALVYLAGRSSTMPRVRKFWRQRSRGYSKTTDIAAMAIWVVAFSQRVLQGVAVAEDREQIGFMRDAMVKLLQENAWLLEYVELQQNQLRSKSNGTILRFATSDVASSFGATPDFVVMDEFTHWSSEPLWDSFYSSYGKRADAGAVLIVGCNAGKARDWKWEKKEMARTSPSWHYSAPPGHSPWYSDETIKDQADGIRHSEVRRLWYNEWQESSGGFVTLAEADNCLRAGLIKAERALPDVAVHIAVLDYAEKKDRTVGTVGHLVDNKLVLDRMDVRDPAVHGVAGPDGAKIIPVEWCHEWMQDTLLRFGTGVDTYGRDRVVHFVMDDYQLKWLIQKYSGQLSIFPIKWHSGDTSYRMAKTLYHMIVNEQVVWYPGCGEIIDADGNVITGKGDRDDLSTEIAALTVKEMSGGRWRFEHEKNAHDDRAFTVAAMAAFVAEHTVPGTFGDI